MNYCLYIEFEMVQKANTMKLASELNSLLFPFFFYAQAVLFLCATSNLNLLCKDGYIFLALSETQI